MKKLLQVMLLGVVVVANVRAMDDGAPTDGRGQAERVLEASRQKQRRRPWPLTDDDKSRIAAMVKEFRGQGAYVVVVPEKHRALVMEAG